MTNLLIWNTKIVRRCKIYFAVWYLSIFSNVALIQFYKYHLRNGILQPSSSNSLSWWSVSWPEFRSPTLFIQVKPDRWLIWSSQTSLSNQQSKLLVLFTCKTNTIPNFGRLFICPSGWRIILIKFCDSSNPSHIFLRIINYLIDFCIFREAFLWQ